jgi:cytochrome o ubiquinol oxidase subunit 2
MNPKGQVAVEQRSLILTAFCLMMLVVVPAVSMALIFSWKYRDTNTQEKYSPEWSHSSKVEAVVWGVPILIIIFLGILTWKSTHALEPAKPLESHLKPIEIDVVALDWKWLFIYPDQHVATINQIAFPAGTPIHFKITSQSVMNSFFIPALGSQIYAMAGMQTQLNLIADVPGTFDGISSNFSGSGFSDMKFKAIATHNNSEFQDWLNKVRESKMTMQSMDEFKKLAEPSERHPVQYFSVANPDIFRQVIHQYMEEDHEVTDVSIHLDHKTFVKSKE